VEGSALELPGFYERQLRSDRRWGEDNEGGKGRSKDRFTDRVNVPVDELHVVEEVGKVRIRADYNGCQMGGH
jgi:hypothetical protein